MAVDLIKMSHNELYVSCLIRMCLGLDKNASIEMSRVWKSIEIRVHSRTLFCLSTEKKVPKKKHFAT